MTTELVKTDAPIVTSDQLDLVRKTVAKDATPDELKLYLYDCARQGVHPLDRLIHFTKRDDRYTPITSIDFMRIRAADSGEYAGSDDAVFGLTGPEEPAHFAATVTVWRLVQGQRCAFTSTARWSEYKAESGSSGKGDRMWRKMPHTMLAKCAEALSLRKGFPRQLAGLYAKEELDQAERPGGYSVTAPPMTAASVLPQGPSEGVPENVSSPKTEASGALYIRDVLHRETRNKNVTKHVLILSDGREVSTIKTQMADLADQLCQNNEPVQIVTKTHEKFGEELIELHRADVLTTELPPITVNDMSF